MYAKRRERAKALKQKAKKAKKGKRPADDGSDNEDAVAADIVPFGYQVDAPPTLTRPKKVLKRQIPLDSSTSPDSAEVRPANEQKQRKTRNVGVGRKVKLKHMGQRSRGILESERAVMIEKYRQLKAQRIADKNT